VLCRSGDKVLRYFLMALLTWMFFAPVAFAGPGSELAERANQLREQAQIRAQHAAQRPAAPAEALDLDDPFLVGLEQFSADAMRLSRAIDAAGGPIDLRCIFRGMSGDSASRLEALIDAASAADQARVYRTLDDLMRDAAEIAPAADDTELARAMTVPLTCPATQE
jgi:hypothetical protein